jgi:hypothetical protein
MTIAELPFHERPIRELLDLDDQRPTVNHDYAGYGWARTDEIWLDNERVRNALVLAVHSADDAEAIGNDIELEFELPGEQPVGVLASAFLDIWLPKLPSAGAIVLASCNPHHATLRLRLPVPLYHAHGNVDAWLDHDRNDDATTRIRLASEHGWRVS